MPMSKKKFSKNPKLNAVLIDIYEQLLELGTEEVQRYYKEFPNEIDYNLYQYGNLIIYTDDIEDMYRKAGYKSKFNYEDCYKRQIGYVTRHIVRKLKK